MQRLMQELCNVSDAKRSHPAGLCKECNDVTSPKGKMKEASNDGSIEDTLQKSGKRVAFLADPCQGHVKAELKVFNGMQGLATEHVESVE